MISRPDVQAYGMLMFRAGQLTTEGEDIAAAVLASAAEHLLNPMYEPAESFAAMLLEQELRLGRLSA